MELKPKLESKLVSENILYKGKWLGIKSLSYTIGDKLLENFETIYRPTSTDKHLLIDGVNIVPIIKSKHRPTQIVLITNFRPAIGKFILEFPAGLTEDTDYDQNAKRELTEETGYIAHKFIKMPILQLFSDPWKSNESSFTYIATIDGDDPNSFVGEKLEENENIQVHMFEINDKLPEQIEEFCKKEQCVVEGKVWSVCVGLLLSRHIKNDFECE